ncbi:MAG: glycosyltransferase family A protein, partial [Paracoccaceae bacterium]
MAHEIPDVTIVVTTYNHAHFLAAALESIKAQTVPLKEIIVVDDGSSDDPAKVVERFSGVKLLKQNNQGLSAARNTGLRAAHGSFVGFLDADDRLLATMVEVNLRQFEHNPGCAFVYGAYQLVDAKGNVTAKPPLCEPGDDAYSSFLVNNLVGMHGTVLYRREILLKEGGFDTTLRAVEDYDVYLRLARNYPVSAEDETLASYFRHDSNMSNDNAFMLKWALAVQGRHRETASTRADWQEAFNLGQQGWKSYFISKQLGTLKFAAKRRNGLRAAVAGTAGILRLEPGATFGEIRRWVRKRLPSGKSVRFGDLRRTTPIDENFGYSRGKPLDRYYIERFLQENAGDIRNRVLEIGDSAYTRQFGGHRVTQADVLNRY